MNPDSSLDAGRSARTGSSAGFQIPAAAMAAAEAALNRYLALDPEGARGFEPLDGRIIVIEILGMDATLTLIRGPEGVQLFGRYDATPDCVIRGTPMALARMAVAERKDREISAGGVEIEGDTGIAHDLAKALSGLDVDWEEQAAKYLGDPIAHQLGQGLRAALQWGRRTTGVFSADLKEYLEEEGRLLPTPYELEGFLAQVDTLRDDVERLGARVERLTQVEVKPKPVDSSSTPVRKKGATGKRSKPNQNTESGGTR